MIFFCGKWSSQTTYPLLVASEFTFAKFRSALMLCNHFFSPFFDLNKYKWFQVNACNTLTGIIILVIAGVFFIHAGKNIRNIKTIRVSSRAYNKHIYNILIKICRIITYMYPVRSNTGKNEWFSSPFFKCPYLLSFLGKAKNDRPQPTWFWQL